MQIRCQKLLLALAATFLLATAFSLVGCPREDACDSVNDCIDKDETGLNLLWQCVDGSCETTPCEASSDCELLNHCQALPQQSENDDPEQVCAEGCLRDSDCPAGNFCRDSVCEPEPCRNGHLDCELGEICQNGACVDAGFPYCEQCNPSMNEYDLGDPDDFCDTRALGHPICGDGNFCWSLPNGASCGVPCAVNSDCPGGFSCGTALLVGELCPGDVISVGRYCVSDFCFLR